MDELAVKLLASIMEQLTERISELSGQVQELTGEVARLKDEIEWWNNKESDTYVPLEFSDEDLKPA